MKKCLVLLALALAACDSKEDGTEKTAAQKCDIDGKKRCTNNTIENCEGNVWVAQTTCTGDDICVATDAYTAACDSEGYDYEGLAVDEVYYYFDNNYIGYHLVEGYSATNADLYLQVEHYPYELHGFEGSFSGTGTQTVSLSGVNADYDSCGLCIFAAHGDTLFMATAGSATGNLQSEIDTEGSLSLSNVLFQEVEESEDDYLLVANGQTWFVESVQVLNNQASTLFPCEYDEPGSDWLLGEQLCTEDEDAFIACYEAYPTDYPGEGFLGIISCDAGDVCVDTSDEAYTAECQAP